MSTLNSVLRFMRDSSWQFVGAIVGVVGLILVLYTSSLVTNRKALEIVILSSTSLVEIDENISDEISVQFDGRPVENVTIIQLKIENTGNTAILKEDFEDPLKIVFVPDVELLEARVLEKQPQNLRMDIAHTDANVVVIPPVLINAGDRAIIRLLVNNQSASPDSTFTVDARIANIREVPILRAIDSVSKGRATRLLIANVQLTLLVLLALWGAIYTKRTIWRTVLIMVVILGVIMNLLESMALGFW